MRRLAPPSEIGQLAAPLARLLDGAWQRMHWWIATMTVLYALSGITVVKPDEVAVVLRWGRLVGETPALQEHGPGLLFTFPRPVVSAINGHAIAGGCVLAAASDARVMAAGNGRIGVPELLVGVPMPSLVVEVCRYAFPPPLLQTLIYRGITLRADEALANPIRTGHSRQTRYPLGNTFH